MSDPVPPLRYPPAAPWRVRLLTSVIRFSDLFIEGDRRVSGDFSVTSTNDGIDCGKVREEMESRVGGDFYCRSHHAWYNDEDAAGVLSTHVLCVLGISMAVGMLLWD